MGNRTVDSQQSAAANSGEPGGEHPGETDYARLSPSDRRFLERLEDVPLLGTLSVEEERARMLAGQSASFDEYPVEVQEFRTSACPVHLIRPAGVETLPPVLFFLHGGGWVLGDLQTHTKLVCELAVRSKCVVAFIDYPRAPEHPFPAPLEACLTAVNEVLQAAKSLKLDCARFAIGGDSSGGNLTAALILESIERSLPIPVRQVLLYPATEHDWTTASYKQFWNNPNLSQFTMKWFWDHYLPEKKLRSDPRVSPLMAGDDVLSLFPPTLVITCEYDVLRDEGERFAARLASAGVDVTATRWLGSLHGFLVTELLAASTSAQTCIDVIARYLRTGFSRG